MLDIAHDVPLAPYTTLALGGPAEHFARIDQRPQLLEAVAWARDHHVPITVLGGGSNVVVSDGGVAGLVLVLATRGVTCTPSGEVHAEAGEPWDGLVELTVTRGLAGLECMSGIPGSVGASPIQNIGAYGSELADCVTSVEVLSLDDLSTRWLTRADCEFGYRTSRWKRANQRDIVLAVKLALQPGGAPTLRYPELARSFGPSTPDLAEVRRSVLALRRGKSMLLDPSDDNHRSVGSFFLNPVLPRPEADAVVARALAAGIIHDPSELPSYPQPDGSLKLSA
ncbi:MAG: UDP-N-acetylmuramate dehydrogenase, partial [Polyangiales bacterium]